MGEIMVMRVLEMVCRGEDDSWHEVKSEAYFSCKVSHGNNKEDQVPGTDSPFISEFKAQLFWVWYSKQIMPNSLIIWEILFFNWVACLSSRSIS